MSPPSPGTINRETQGTQTARRGGAEHVAWDETTDRAPESDTAAGFDRDWALALIKRALAALEDEMTAAGKAAQFHALQPWLDGGSPGASKDAANALGLTENAFNVAVRRMRQRFRHLVRAEVEATTTSPAEADEEFRHLVNVLTAE